MKQKTNNIRNSENKENIEEVERCVMCGQLTHVLKSEPIDFRENYEVGCGQLCIDCYNELQNK